MGFEEAVVEVVVVAAADILPLSVQGTFFRQPQDFVFSAFTKNVQRTGPEYAPRIYQSIVFFSALWKEGYLQSRCSPSAIGMCGR